MLKASRTPKSCGLILDDGSPVYGLPEMGSGIHDCELDGEPAKAFTWREGGIQTGFVLLDTEEEALKRRMVQYTSAVRGIS